MNKTTDEIIYFHFYNLMLHLMKNQEKLIPLNTLSVMDRHLAFEVVKQNISLYYTNRKHEWSRKI